MLNSYFMLQISGLHFSVTLLGEKLNQKENIINIQWHDFYVI